MWCYIFLAYKEVHSVYATPEALHARISELYDAQDIIPLEELQNRMNKNRHAFLDADRNFEVAKMIIY